MSAPDPVCDLSELPASQCACRRHRGGAVVEPDDEPVRAGPVIRARYFGTCVACGHVIIAGRDQIQALVGREGYAHSPTC